MSKSPVAEFIEKFGASRDPELWLKLVEEEVKEAEEALTALLKELADVRYVVEGMTEVAGVDKAARLFEPLFFRFARICRFFDADELAPVMEEVFKRVHESNMSKLGDDGKPVLREDGKILKGPNYKPPVLGDLI